MVSVAGGPILQGDIRALNQGILQQNESGPDQFYFESLARVSIPRFRQIIVNLTQPPNILPIVEADPRRVALLITNAGAGGSIIFIDTAPVIATNLGYPLAATISLSILGYQGPIYALGSVNNILVGIIELLNPQ